MSRDSIENRENEPVSNKAQYCSVVRTGIGKTILCLGGEVDAGTNFHRRIAFLFFLLSSGTLAHSRELPPRRTG